MLPAEQLQIKDCKKMRAIGLTPEMIKAGIDYVHEILDCIDHTLLGKGEERMSGLVELTNLSSIIGNLLRAGIGRASKGKFKPNAPHKYPDLLAVHQSCKAVEIKVALENNKPKGHLVKPGPHITCRYVLCADDGSFTREKRGVIARIWEVRVGVLQKRHFNISNTKKDSGKTATVNAAGMNALVPVFLDKDRCPWSPRGKSYRAAFPRPISQPIKRKPRLRKVAV